MADAIQRQPQPIRAYNTYEWQGEAICWLDDDTFYTTSDADAGWDPPIYKYTRQNSQGVETVQADNRTGNRLVFIDRTLYIRSRDALYTLDGRRVK